MDKHYPMEAFHLAELLLLLAEDDAITAADMIKALNEAEDTEND